MDKQTADEILRHTGHLALLYYSELAADDPDYTLADDVDRILRVAPALHPELHAHLRELIAAAILDPTGTRDALAAALYPTAD